MNSVNVRERRPAIHGYKPVHFFSLIHDMWQERELQITRAQYKSISVKPLKFQQEIVKKIFIKNS
jgi:hypothetical protein